MELAASSLRCGMPPQSPADRRLAAALRQEREAQGRSQEALAHDAGLTVNALSRIERGQANPAWTTVVQVADALGLSLTELARRVEREP
jgi:XRE family transcriptional regulator, regulator of sulfur utilization